MKLNRAGALAPWIVAMGLAVAVTGCRSKVEEERREMADARKEYRETRQDAEQDVAEARARADERIAEADARIAEEEQELRAAEVGDPADRTHSDERLARLDDRLLELQARINQLPSEGTERGVYESTWEQLDERRSTIRREGRGLESLRGGELEGRRRDLDDSIQSLEEDVEQTIDDIEARLSRG